MASQTPRASTESLLLDSLQDNNKTIHGAEYNNNNLNDITKHAGYRLPRFYTRALMAIFVPGLVTVYYFSIRNIIIKRENDVIKSGFPGEVWLYYSWFVVGVFGLNLSRYALLGIEAAMLQDNFWQVNNAMALLMHCGASWSGPIGWITALRGAWMEEYRSAHHLWYTLATLSLLASIALPLSGLGFKLSEGYISLPEPPRVAGRTFDTFQKRAIIEARIRAGNSWKEGSPPLIPGFGIGYTSPGRVDRSTHSSFTATPNSIPIDGVIPDVFLTPQAETPINGRVWGMRVDCNCSIVKSASELTILSQKPSSRFSDRDYPWTSVVDKHPFRSLITPMNDTIYVSNTTKIEIDGAWWESNLFGYSEVGLTTNVREDNTYASTTNGGAPRVKVLEYVVWQVHMFSLVPKLKFNYTIDVPIAGLGHPVIFESNGTMSLNNTFLSALDHYGHPGQYGKEAPFPSLIEPPPKGIQPIALPVGVRCVRTSAFGYADVSAQGTYHSFTESIVPRSPLGNFGSILFGELSDWFLLGQYLDHFRSTHSPFPVSKSVDSYFTNYIQASTLLQSISQAHAVDALQLMYDGASYSNSKTYYLANATSSRKDKVIVEGMVPLTLPAVLLVIWATGSAILGLLYGFRRRWSEVLDGYSIFSFGVDCAEAMRDRHRYSGTGGGLNRCDALRSIPGLVGDSRPRDEVGHISLVERGNLADREKPYV
ncbi:hypothetical protein MferCBS31731_001509 [Microsporum ferrugineum]